VNWLDLDWKCHGLGMAKAYISPTRRVHVWDKRLRHPGRWEESIHSHRWDMHSLVVAGRIKQEEFFASPDPHGTHMEWSVANTTSADPHALTLVSEQRLQLRRADTIVRAGESYSMPRGSFHRTDAVDGTVTLMSRFDPHGLSSCLIPVGVLPKHGHDWSSPPDVLAIIREHTSTSACLTSTSFRSRT